LINLHDAKPTFILGTGQRDPSNHKLAAEFKSLTNITISE